MFCLRNLLKNTNAFSLRLLSKSQQFYRPVYGAAYSYSSIQHKSHISLTEKRFASFSKDSAAEIDFFQKIDKAIDSSKQYKLEDSISSFQQVIQNLSRKGSSPQKKDRTLLIKAHYELGKVYQKREELSEALKEYSQALSFAQKGEILDKKQLLDIYNSIGEVNISLNLFDEARKYLDKVQQSLEKSTESMSGINNTILKNKRLLASIYINEGHTNEALKLLESILRDSKPSSENLEASIELAYVYQTMGNVLHRKEDYSKAHEYWNQGLQIVAGYFGENSVHLLPFHECIVVGLFEQNNLKECASYQEKNLQIVEKNCPENSAEVAKHNYLLGNIEFERRDFVKALEHCTKALNVYLNYPDKYAENIANLYQKIAQIYLIQEKKDQCLDNYSKGLDFCLKHLGDSHTKLGDYYLLYGDLKYKEEKLEEAKTYFNKALDIYLKKPEAVEKDTITDIYFDLGVISYLEQSFNDALKYFQESLTRSLEDGSRLKVIEDTYNFIGLIHLRQKKSEESVENFNKALELCLKSNEQQHIDVYYRNIGLGYDAGGKLEECAQHYRKALDCAVKNFGQDSKITLEYAEALVDKLAILGKFDEAVELQRAYKLKKEQE